MRKLFLLFFSFSLAVVPGFSVAQSKPAWTPDEQKIVDGIKTLRAAPDAERGKKTEGLALQIQALPACQNKLRLADALSNLATEGDPGHEALQAVTTALAEALNQTPQPAHDGVPASQYLDVARLVHYEGMQADVEDAQFEQAMNTLKSNDVDVQNVAFSLEGFNTKPLGMKKVSLQALRGKVVMVNFWATWCPPCRKEMPTLDAIWKHFDGKVVVLSISDETAEKVSSFLAQSRYSAPVLLDSGGKVAKLFHVEGIPQTFVFNADGKLVAHAIDMRTEKQFLAMLATAGVSTH